MGSIMGCVAAAGISFFVAFWMARSCLGGVIRLMIGVAHRNVLSSQP